MCCSVTTYVVIIFSRITQALDVSDDITTLKEDLKQEMTVSNYVSFKVPSLSTTFKINVGLLLLSIYSRWPRQRKVRSDSCALPWLVTLLLLAIHVDIKGFTLIMYVWWDHCNNQWDSEAKWHGMVPSN